MEPKTTRMSKDKSLVSHLPVRRGDWILQVSIFKNMNVMVIYNHYYDKEKFGINYFDDHDAACDFIEQLIRQE